jgi:DNA polymerase V
MSAKQLALKLMKKIYDTTKIYSTCGIGPNMIMAKYALDIESKHNSDWLAEWTYDDVYTKLFKITDIRSLWGIGRSMEKHLRALGVITVEDINNLGVEFLYKKFGIMGEELFLHVNGIDISRIQDQNIIRTRKSFSIGQTLFTELYNDEILTVLTEMTYEQVLKMRESKLKTQTISIMIGYNRKCNINRSSMRKKMMSASSEFSKILQVVEFLFRQLYIKNMPARNLSISMTDLVDHQHEQLNLFSNKKHDESKLEDAVIEIRNKYGKSSIMLAASEKKEATQKMRNKLIGGHNAQNES